MPALVAGIHRLSCDRLASKAWMAGASPAMTPAQWVHMNGTRTERQLRPVLVAGMPFETVRQFLVTRCDFAHLLPDVRVPEGLGSGRHFLGACAHFHGKR